MELNSISAIVTGGASGLGKARTFFFEKKNQKTFIHLAECQ